jgi:hypothetical protein
LIGIALVLLAFVIAIVAHKWSLVYRNLFFVFGAVVLTEGFGSTRACAVTLRKTPPAMPALPFRRLDRKETVSGYTFTLAGCIVVVAIAQALSNFQLKLRAW